MEKLNNTCGQMHCLTDEFSGVSHARACETPAVTIC